MAMNLISLTEEMATISTDVQKAANQAAKALGYTDAKQEQLEI